VNRRLSDPDERRGGDEVKARGVQVVAEIYGGGPSYSGSGWWLRGYVYLGGQMIAT